MRKQNPGKSALPRIDALADLAKISLTQSEMKRFQPQITEVLAYFERLADLESGGSTDEAESKHLSDIRGDEQTQFNSSDIMNIAKSKKGRFVKGPRMA